MESQQFFIRMRKITGYCRDAGRRGMFFAESTFLAHGLQPLRNGPVTVAICPKSAIIGSQRTCEEEKNAKKHRSF